MKSYLVYIKTFLFSLLLMFPISALAQVNQPYTGDLEKRPSILYDFRPFDVPR